jgi:hypothetical protein
MAQVNKHPLVHHWMESHFPTPTSAPFTDNSIVDELVLS